MTKDEIKAELDALGVDYDSTALKSELKDLLEAAWSEGIVVDEPATTTSGEVIRNKGV